MTVTLASPAVPPGTKGPAHVNMFGRRGGGVEVTDGGESYLGEVDEGGLAAVLPAFILPYSAPQAKEL